MVASLFTVTNVRFDAERGRQLWVKSRHNASVLFGANLGRWELSKPCVIRDEISNSTSGEQRMFKRVKTDLARLEIMLRDLEQLLRQHDQAHWAEAVAGAYQAAQSGDLLCAQKSLSMYGGMGAINDLYLADDGANLRLDGLLKEIYVISQRLERKRVGWLKRILSRAR